MAVDRFYHAYHAWQVRRYGISVVLLVVLYAVGAFGVMSQWRTQFIALSFANLIVTAGLLLLNVTPLTPKPLWAFLFCGTLGFVIEVLGVKTGFIFGAYSYSERMGPRLFEVPWVIGLNWAVLAHCMLALLGERIRSRFGLVFVGATLMTVFDWFMEPAAIALGFWTWQGQAVPMRNYVAWWVASFSLLFIAEHIGGRPKNPLARWVVVAMLVFFLAARTFAK
jgi:putative membrane protein